MTTANDDIMVPASVLSTLTCFAWDAIEHLRNKGKHELAKHVLDRHNAAVDILVKEGVWPKRSRLPYAN